MASQGSQSPTNSPASITKWIQFQDEAPKIGNGRRHVQITIGRKWVKVRCVATGKSHKFSKAQWSKIDNV